jgi:hypothetical protein
VVPQVLESDEDQFGGLLADIEAAVGEDERVRFGDLLAAMGARGFGPLLCLLALALILPSGMIPGLPNAVAVLLAFVGVEMALGNRALRLPRRLRDWQISGDRVRAFAQRTRPLAARAARLVRPRYGHAVTSRPALLVIAGTLIVTALVLFVVGFIPGLPFLIAVPVLLVGLGLTARDGVLLAAGLALLLMPLGAIVSWIFRPGPVFPESPEHLEQMLQTAASALALAFA